MYSIPGVLLSSRTHGTKVPIRFKNVSFMRDTEFNRDTKTSLTCIRSYRWDHGRRTQKLMKPSMQKTNETIAYSCNRSCRYRQRKGLGVYIAAGRHCPCRGRAETGVRRAASRRSRPRRRHARRDGGSRGAGVIAARHRTYSACRHICFMFRHILAVHKLFRNFIT